MITVIRNDHHMRYAHDIYDVKIKEEKPMYKLIGTTRNDTTTLFECPNYAVTYRMFEVIINAILNGEKSVVIIPPIEEPPHMAKDDFDCSDVHDFVPYNDDKRPPEYDFYNRKIDETYMASDCHTVYEEPTTPNTTTQYFYKWQEPEELVPPQRKNSFDNKFLNNRY